jgi:hypothetical protein
MQILSVIVQDINAATIPKYSAKFRKAGKSTFVHISIVHITHMPIAAGLRDTQLLDIFENAFQILEGILSRSIPFDKRKYRDNKDKLSVTDGFFLFIYF